MEASSVTGPAKNLLAFFRELGSQASTEGRVTIRPAIATFKRTSSADERAIVNSLHPPMGTQAENAFVAAATAYGVDTHTINERFRFDRAVIPGLRSIVQRVQPDIIQTHGVKSHFLMRLSGIWRRRTWIAFHHGYTTTDAKMLAYNQLDRWSLRAARMVVTVSQPMAADLARRGVHPERIKVVHNSIGAADLAALQEEQLPAMNVDKRPHQKVVLSVGRLSREKGHIDLILAMKALKAKNSDSKIKLIIVGGGPERPRLEQAANDAGLHADVAFAGQVGDVKPYYRAADVFVLPSHSEGSPNALLEAMAAGVPVVAANVGGVPEIIKDGTNGLLVPSRDPAALAAGIRRLLSDPAESSRLANNARSTVIANHSPQARSLSLLSAYMGLVAPHNGGMINAGAWANEQ